MASDSFTTGTDQALTSYSSNWTDPSSDFNVQASTDTAYASASGYSIAWYNAETFTDDQESSVTISARGSGAYTGVGVRLSGTSGSEDGYILYTDSGTCYFEKIVNGTVTEFDSATAPAVGVVLKLKIEGSTITPYYDGSTTGAPSGTTDSSVTSGSAGMSTAFGSSSTRVDDFLGTSLGSPDIAGTAAGTSTVTGTIEDANATLEFGDLFIYREATGLDGDVNTPGDTYDHQFDTNVSVPHTAGPSISGANITLPEGQWVVLYSTQYEENGGTNRTELNSFFRKDSADTNWGWSQCFVRRNGGADEGIMTASALLDSNGSNVYNLRTINQQGPNGDGTTRNTRRSANGTQISFLYLGNDDLDWIRAYQSTDTSAQSLDSQTWTDITMDTTGGSNGSAFSHSSGTITWSGTTGQFAMFGGSIANTREESTNRLALAGRFAVGGTGRGQDTSYCYSRGDQSSEDLRDGVVSLTAIIEKASASEDITIETQRIESTAVTSTVRAEGTSFWAIELPDDSELVLVSGGTGNINGNATVSLSTPDEIHSNFTNNTTNIATDVSMSVLAFGQWYSTDAVTRSYPRIEIRENGSYANAGLGGSYNRNQVNQATTVGGTYAGAIASTAVDDQISIYGTPLGATGTQNLASFSLYILRTDNLTAPSGSSNISGTSDGTTTTTATIEGLTALSGAISGLATVTATILGLTTLEGAASGTSTVTGSIQGLASIDGAISGTSTTSATVEGLTALTAVTAGTSTTTGTIEGLTALQGSASGTSTASATPESGVNISGAIAGTSTVSGTIEGLTALQGSTAGTSTASATPEGSANVAGAISGTSTVTGSIEGLTALDGAAAGTSTTTATIQGLTSLSGVSAGTSSTTADIEGLAALQGTVAGTSTVTGSLELPTGQTSGASAGSSTTSGTIQGLTALQGSASGAASITATIEGQTALSGTSAGTTSTAANLSAFGLLSGTANGLAALSGTLAATGNMAGLASGTSTATGILVIFGVEVPLERTFAVRVETRTFAIEAESRVFAVKGESRVFAAEK